MKLGLGKSHSIRIATLLTTILILGIPLIAPDVQVQAVSGYSERAMRNADLGQNIESPGKPLHPKLSTPLDELYNKWLENQAEATGLASSRGLQLMKEQVLVMVIMESEDAATDILPLISGLGGEITAHFKQWVDAWVPIRTLEKLSLTPGVIVIRRPIKVFPLGGMESPDRSGMYAGLVVTQGLTASNANAWHSAGLTGNGMKVAVLDSFKDYTLAQANNELPPSITTYGALDITSSRHGTAVAEIIYDMAPGVSFTFASPSSATEMASYITSLAASGNRIISSSMGFYSSEPGDGTGPVSGAINDAKNTYGTLYVAAAGNQAEYHWDGVYSDTDGDDIHEFAPGVEVNELDYASSGYGIYIFLRWNSWPVTNEDYDLYLVYWNDSAWEVVAESENDQDGGTLPPTEEIWYTAAVGGYYGVVIVDYSTSGSHVLDLMGHNAPNFYVNVPGRSLIDQATAANSFSVAAVDASTYNLQSYSSRGPTHGTGGSLGGGMDQPRLAGYTNVDTWSYAPGTFGGTSAAAPHVSGAAALIWAAYPGYTSDHVRNFLETRAIDAGPAGYDHSYGAGRLYLGDPPDMLYLPFIAK